MYYTNEKDKGQETKLIGKIYIKTYQPKDRDGIMTIKFEKENCNHRIPQSYYPRQKDRKLSLDFYIKSLQQMREMIK